MIGFSLFLIASKDCGQPWLFKYAKKVKVDWFNLTIQEIKVRNALSKYRCVKETVFYVFSSLNLINGSHLFKVVDEIHWILILTLPDIQ